MLWMAVRIFLLIFFLSDKTALFLIYDQYPFWSTIAHLPVALKLLLARILGSKIFDMYVSLEAAAITHATEYETELLEPLLISRLKAEAAI